MRTTLCSLALLLAAATSPVAAQGPAASGERDPKAGQEGWYYDSGEMKLDPQQVHMQKAAQRGAQRSARIAAMNWYGMNNSRPTASATPFTGMYSPAWQAPGGRPFSWRPRTYTSNVYIVR
ncbi:hypothetical protein Pla123a_16920 [Posidoniimonas polymericola]|uniref:Uncharacterized protein n=1 Tax=Posidoniimonas polymericola TaxID=2528002 RepID=A0A5C5YT30_9BACT|nr:hypothetical protein [Posidoniimonas polymericola]TWT77893.1 hypothetical protein Pla123a_16920 [Posidoniimonas polymericola]